MTIDILEHLSEEYFEHNGTQYDVLEELPEPLEFARLARIARPVLIRASTLLDSDDPTAWSNEWIVQKMGDCEISVAVTPNGRADAITRGPDDKLYFVEPHVEKMTMESFLSMLSDKPPSGAGGSGGNVHYLQSQNGNLFTSRYFDVSAAGGDDESEFEPLRAHVPSEVPWCSDALDRSPDAVNLWIGDARSVTSIHSDPYENIYTVVRGTKHFTLFPPTESWCMRERRYPHATYQRPSPTSPTLTLVPSPPTTPFVRWASIAHPERLGLGGDEAGGAHPLRVSVHAGETLYLPAGWWHAVAQAGVTVAVNYWYDAEPRGAGWVWLDFLRGGRAEVPLGNASEGDGEDVANGEGEGGEGEGV